MSWYKKAKFISELEDPNQLLKDTHHDSPIQEAIKILHELEYKSSQISQRQMNPKRQENILNRIHDWTYRYFLVIRKSMVSGFKNWLYQHPIHSRKAWSNMILRGMKQYAEDGGYDYPDFLLDTGFDWGGATLSISDFVENIDKKQIYDLVEQDYRFDPEYFDSEMDYWLNMTKPKWVQENMSASDYISNHNLSEAFLKYYTNNLDIREFVNLIRPEIKKDLINDNVVLRTISKKLYPAYIDKWGNRVRGIIENVQEAINRLNSIGENSTISEMGIAVSLAMNVVHTSGNILEDALDLDKAFLDDMRDRSVEDWNAEIIKEFAV